MRIKNDYVLREIAGEYIIVTIVKKADDFNGLITVNDVGKFLWENMQEEFSIKSVTKKLMDEYEVDEETAKEDVTEFINKLKDKNIIVG